MVHFEIIRSCSVVNADLLQLSFEEVVPKGLASDGGLFIPEESRQYHRSGQTHGRTSHLRSLLFTSSPIAFRLPKYSLRISKISSTRAIHTPRSQHYATCDS